MINVVFAERHN